MDEKEKNLNKCDDQKCGQDSCRFTFKAGADVFDVCIIYYPSGKIHQQFLFKNAKKDGYFISWYENGLLSEVSEYKNDKRDGVHAYFEDDGSVGFVKRYEKNNMVEKLDVSDDDLDGAFKSLIER
jgi:antitoxin component YwqK of YwqJK toxin-antitoxin module